MVRGCTNDGGNGGDASERRDSCDGGDGDGVLVMSASDGEGRARGGTWMKVLPEMREGAGE